MFRSSVNTGEIVIASVISKGRKLATILPVPEWRRRLWHHGVAAGVEHAAVLRHLGEVRTVVDIGANRGQFALVARRCFPAAQIVSFEPLANPAAVYRTVFEGDPRTTLHQAAVGSDGCEATIHLSARDDCSSLLPIAALQNTLFSGTAEVGIETVRMVRLAEHVSADAIEALALLKLDVQGFELQALHGCEDLLGRFAWVYAECSFVELYVGQALADTVIAWLRERGLTLRGLYNVAYDRDGTAIQADFLFGR